MQRLVVRRDVNTIHPAVKKLVTVCRCNNVKYGTIERAIAAGAKTIAEVAAKTTATTGRCGGSCTPRVLEMIEARWADAAMSTVAEDDPEDAWWIRTAITNDCSDCADQLDHDCSPPAAER